MDVITMETAAYKELIEKINNIERFIVEKSQHEMALNEAWVDSDEVCQYLCISERTLQRLRSKKEIAYSVLQGKTYYTLMEIKRMLDARTIRRGTEHLDELIMHYQNKIQKIKNKHK